jgi:hypothetical protein
MEIFAAYDWKPFQSCYRVKSAAGGYKWAEFP